MYGIWNSYNAQAAIVFLKFTVKMLPRAPSFVAAGNILVIADFDKCVTGLLTKAFRTG
jgi:hypothetical protein